YHHHGQTALLDNVQAAVLDFKLSYLPEWIEHRCQIASLYRQGLAENRHISLPHFTGDEYFDVYQNYVIRTPRRDELRAFLKENGIETLVSWPQPMWHHRGLRLGEHRLPETEAICREVISLPMSAETTEEQVKVTVECVNQFFKN